MTAHNNQLSEKQLMKDIAKDEKKLIKEHIDKRLSKSKAKTKSHKTLETRPVGTKNSDPTSQVMVSDSHGAKRFVKALRKIDNSMTYHMLSPDTCPPVHIADIEDLTMKNVTFTGNLYRTTTRQFTAGAVGLQDSMMTGFSPLLEYGSIDFPIVNDVIGISASFPDWMSVPQSTNVYATYNAYRLLGYKIVAKNISPQLQKGGSHAFFTVRPGVAPVAAATLLSVDFVVKQDPLNKLLPAQEDACAVFIATDLNAYKWNQFGAPVIRAATSAPQIEYLNNTSNHLELPYFIHFASGETGQIYQYDIYQYMQFIQLPGEIPPGIADYTNRLVEYAEAVKRNPKDTTLKAPTLSLGAGPPMTQVTSKPSADTKWYDKVAYALTGQGLTGALKNFGKSLLTKLPEMLAYF